MTDKLKILDSTKPTAGNRREFLKKIGSAASIAMIGIGLLSRVENAQAQVCDPNDCLAASAYIDCYACRYMSCFHQWVCAGSESVFVCCEGWYCTFLCDPDPYCFVAGTLVATPAGLVPIESIEIGDLVHSAEIDSMGEKVLTLTPVENRVSAIHESLESAFLSLSIGNEKITCTSKHRFFVEGLGWTPAEELQVGARFIPREGGRMQVLTNRESITESRKVYNLTVEGTQNYFVGSQGLLVHNVK